MCVRSFVRPSVTLIGPGPDLVRRNGVLPLVRRSSTPKTDRFRDHLWFSDKKVNYVLINWITRWSSSVASLDLIRSLHDQTFGPHALRVLSSKKFIQCSHDCTMSSLIRTFYNDIFANVRKPPDRGSRPSELSFKSPSFNSGQRIHLKRISCTTQVTFLSWL